MLVTQRSLHFDAELFISACFHFPFCTSFLSLKSKHFDVFWCYIYIYLFIYTFKFLPFFYLLSKRLLRTLPILRMGYDTYDHSSEDFSWQAAVTWKAIRFMRLILK
jgi:putative component of membrane protein insertase Oxa1/YidC/SpoIIIJ protein YidD